MKLFIFEYENESEFKKKERALRKYNMLAFKKLTFEYYPALRSGKFLGKLISKSQKNKTETYELKLPTDDLFIKVHGEVILHYTVYTDSKIILLNNISPDKILSEGHRAELNTYKGVMVSKTEPEKDIFKINLLSKLNK